MATTFDQAVARSVLNQVEKARGNMAVVGAETALRDLSAWLRGYFEPALPDEEAPYCARCDHDQHRCPGCGDSVAHGRVACDPCMDLL